MKIVLIKIPTEIYPNIFDTFVYLFSQAGIKNISIEKKVDFQKLYNETRFHLLNIIPMGLITKS